MVEQHIVCRKVITVKVCELQLILKSVKNYSALSQLGVLVAENCQTLKLFSYLVPVIAKLVLHEQPVTFSTTGTKYDAVKHLLEKKNVQKHNILSSVCNIRVTSS